MYDSTIAKCAEVRRARRPLKMWSVILSAGLSLAIMYAISHGYKWQAAALVVLAVFGPVGAAAKLKENTPFFAFLRLKDSSWGFVSMGTTLAAAAYFESGQWSTLKAHGWVQFFHIPSDGFRAWGWWAFAVVIIALYAKSFRTGEAKHYRDYLRFNSWKKILHDFVSAVVSFVPVICGLPVVLGGDWFGNPTAPTTVVVLIVLWFILGMIDLKRFSWDNEWGLSREKLHIPADVNGRPCRPVLKHMVSPGQFREEYLRDRRRDKRGPHEPG